MSRAQDADRVMPQEQFDQEMEYWKRNSETVPKEPTQPPTPAAEVESQRDRAIFDAGFRACRSFGDNHAHYHGEQADRVFAGAMARIPDHKAKEAERLLRLTCEHVCGTPVAEQSDSLADISLAIESSLTAAEHQATLATEQLARLRKALEESVEIFRLLPVDMPTTPEVNRQIRENELVLSKLQGADH